MKHFYCVVLGVLLSLFASPAAFAEDPGWHYGQVVGIHTNGLQPLRIRLDPSTREKCGGESDYVGVNHPDLAGDAYRAHQTNALHLLAAAMRQRARVAVHLAEQYDDGGAMYCLATAVRAQPPPADAGSDDDGASSSGSDDDGGSSSGGTAAEQVGVIVRSETSTGYRVAMTIVTDATVMEARRRALEGCDRVPGNHTGCNVIFTFPAENERTMPFCGAYAESTDNGRYWGAAYILETDPSNVGAAVREKAIGVCNDASPQFDCVSELGWASCSTP